MVLYDWFINFYSTEISCIFNKDFQSLNLHSYLRCIKKNSNIIVGPEVWCPSPLYIQGPKPKLRSPIAEDDLTLNTSQNAWRKGQTQYRSKIREKAANTTVWSPASDRPILQTMLFNISQPLPTTRMYGLIGRVYSSKSKTYTWTRKGK